MRTLQIDYAGEGEEITTLLTAQGRQSAESYIADRERLKAKMEEKGLLADALAADLDADRARQMLQTDAGLREKLAASGQLKSAVFQVRDTGFEDRFAVQDLNLPTDERIARACFERLAPTVASGLSGPIPPEFYEPLATWCKGLIFYSLTERQRFLSTRLPA